MGKRFLSALSFVSILLLFLLFLPQPVSARHRSRVLGVATNSSTPTIPPTAQGPGLILPDSPLFFLDQVKQNVRVFFAFNPEAKAIAYEAIAGERMAELRFMLARKSNSGVKVALEGVQENLQKSADELATTQLQGKDVSGLARKLNTSIKEKREVLDYLEEQTGGELKARVTVVQESLDNSKIKVEDALPDDELDNEIRDSLERKAEKDATQAFESATDLVQDIKELKIEASEAAKQSLTRREEALKKAIEEKNEALKKAEEKLLEAEKKKQEQLLKVQDKVAEQAREAVKNAMEAAKKFKSTQKTVENIRNQAVESIPTPSSLSSSSSVSPTRKPSQEKED